MPGPPITTLPQCVEQLSAGGVVAIPTETVYGLAADARNARAVARIFQLKGRPSTNPLIVHVASIEIARRYCTGWDDRAQKLAEVFWPGPLTLILNKTGDIVDQVTAGGTTVGLRVPRHPLTLELLRQFDGPLAAPSANISNHVSPTSAQHVRDEFGDEVPILDGGPCTIGIESTVLDLTQHPPRILRPGQVTANQIKAVVGSVIDQTGAMVSKDIPALSPGQHEKHYAPRTPAYRIEAHQAAQLDLTDAALMPLTLDPETYARNFYARLRLLDTQNLRAIYVEMPPDQPEWSAIRDRIQRATVPLPA